MKKKNLEKYWQKKAEEYRDYCHELERERNDLIDQLSGISQGFVLPDQPSTWSLSDRLSDRAARTVKKYAYKKESAKPKGYFYP